VVPEPTLLVWTWSLPPYAQITPEKMLDKIAKAKNRVVISTTAFTLQPVIDMLKSSQADEKTVLVGCRDFRHIQA
jgi:hypothetical protein